MVFWRWREWMIRMVDCLDLKWCKAYWVFLDLRLADAGSALGIQELRDSLSGSLPLIYKNHCICTRWSAYFRFWSLVNPNSECDCQRNSVAVMLTNVKGDWRWLGLGCCQMNLYSDLFKYIGCTVPTDEIYFLLRFYSNFQHIQFDSISMKAKDNLLEILSKSLRWNGSHYLDAAWAAECFLHFLFLTIQISGHSTV